MFCEIPDLLNAGEVAQLREMAGRMRFQDGRASNPGSKTKNNLHADPSDPLEGASSNVLMNALRRNATFIAYAFPKMVAPPTLTIHREGMHYGAHADAAFMPVGQRPLRADLSCTIFLNEPDAYDGGELSVRLGTREVDFKLKPGGAVLYPSTTIHQVRPVTRGERLAGITFIESDIADRVVRELLFELNEVLHEEGEKLSWEARTRLAHVSESLRRQWGDAG